MKISHRPVAVGMVVAFTGIACSRATPPASAIAPPERFTLTRNERAHASCGLTVVYDGGGHTIEQGGERTMVTFTLAADGKSEKRTLMAREAGEEQRSLGYRWKLIEANGFNAPKVTIEISGK